MKFKIILSLLHMISFTNFAIAMEVSEEERYSFKYVSPILSREMKITVIITNEDWNHIREGQEEQNDYSGGHDVEIYFANHIKNDPTSTLYFDIKTKTFIASSKKGTSLPTIISKIASGARAKYHTLFPSYLLTKDFAVRAFAAAYADPHFVDEAQLAPKRFQAVVDGYAVAGFYRKVGLRTYRLVSLFPNIAPRYQDEFGQKNSSSTVQILDKSRFLKWDHAGGSWLREIFRDQEPETQMSLLLPLGEIVSLCSPSSSAQNTSTTSVFSTLSEMKDCIADRLLMAAESEKRIDFLDFFFNDASNPTQVEFDNLVSMIAKFLPTFSFVGAKATTLKAQISLFRFTLFRSLKQDNGLLANIIHYFPKQYRFQTTKEYVGVSREALQIPGGGLKIGSLHFGEEFMRRILLIDMLQDELADDFSGLTNHEREIAHHVIDNLHRFLNPRSSRTTNAQRDIGFHLVPYNEDYALEIFFKSDVSSKNFRRSSIPVEPLFCVRGHTENPLWVNPISFGQCRAM